MHVPGRFHPSRPAGLGSLLLAPLLLAFLGGCGNGTSPDARPARVLMIAVESMSWERLDPLIESGELPHLARLVREGARAKIQSPDPLDANMLWVTALTGKQPRTHRVVGELLDLEGMGRALLPSSSRMTKNILQVASDEELEVVSVGLPNTWPAEIVNGFLVGPGATESRWTATEEHTYDRGDRSRDTYPPSLRRDVAPLLRSADDIRREEASRFFTLNEREFAMLYDEPLGSIYRKDNPLRDFGITYQRDLSYVDVLLDLCATHGADLAAIHLELLDSLQPVYWPFSEPDRYEVPSDSRRRFRETVNEAYRFVDEQIGRMVEALPPGSTVCVVSERGFGTRAGGADSDRPVASYTNEAVFVLWGQGVAQGEDLGRIDLADVTPTLLALLDAHIGADMEGIVREEALDPAFLAAHPRRAVETHDTDFEPEDRYPGVSARYDESGGEGEE